MSGCGCASPTTLALGPSGSGCDGPGVRTPNPIGPDAALDCRVDVAQIDRVCRGVYQAGAACEALAEFLARRYGPVRTITREERPDQFGPCGPIGPGNQPIYDCEYQASPGATLQGLIDIGRRVAHEVGFRAYRVWLVWVERDATQRYVERKRIELMPIKVSSLASVDVVLDPTGLRPDGQVTLTNISPVQVDEGDLRGYLDGAPLPSGWDFFYEVRRYPRCAGEQPLPRRFTIASLPHWDAPGFQYVVRIVDQEVPRSVSGADQTFRPLTGPISKTEVLRR